MQPRQILAALADLAPSSGERILDVTRNGQPLVWFDDGERLPSGRPLERLAALDALHREERILRQGWGMLVGTTLVDGTKRKVCLPLLSQPVRLARQRPVAAGDLEITPLIVDRLVATQLEMAPGIATASWLTATGTPAWLRTAAAAAGFPDAPVVPKPTPGLPDGTVEIVTRPALFTARDVLSAGLRDTLLSWASRPGLESTALAAVYRSNPETSTVDESPVLSPLPLNNAQRTVVRRARTEPVVVVSGPPGNGKSHAVVAAALDVVDRGGSVLVATQSSHAADVLGDLLARYPGPAPVLFGDSGRREAIAQDLASGTAAGVPESTLRTNDSTVRVALGRVGALRRSIAEVLDTETRAASLPQWEPLIPSLAADAPGAFESTVDLRVARALAERAVVSGDTWWDRLRGRWAAYRLRRLVGARATVPLEGLRTALDAASARRAAADLAARGGTDLTPTWRALWEAEDALAEAVGAAMRDRATSAARRHGDARRSAAALGTALRAGRNRRREMLAHLDGPALVRALPLWVGTVTDVEDLLPSTPGLFDLVILDEAAHIDQIRAAPVLARARRALVVGDPRQLRFVSFVADVDVATTLAKHGLSGLADRLDVRRASAFDVAAGAAPVTWLSEHFRSVPHLIAFSARRFYSGRIDLVTRHPRLEKVDAIDVVHVDGAVVDGVNRAEVDAVVTLVREARRVGSVGVVTPFRAQADALESALLSAFKAAQIERMGLRSGTVHAFQGSEADVIIASLGLVEGDSAGRFRFVADANLFNVLITRARRRMIVVTSLREASGLVGEYLAYAESPLSTVASDVPGGDGWPTRLALELGRTGSAVRAGYPVGSWVVDLCVGEGDEALGLICGVHPDGAEAHVERQRVLGRAGWRLADAFASRWQGDPIRAALDIASGS